MAKDSTVSYLQVNGMARWRRVLDMEVVEIRVVQGALTSAEPEAQLIREAKASLRRSIPAARLAIETEGMPRGTEVRNLSAFFYLINSSPDLGKQYKIFTFLRLTLQNDLINLPLLLSFFAFFRPHSFAALATTPRQDPALARQAYALVFRTMEAATCLV